MPEFLGKRFNITTQRVNAVTFALAQVLVAGVNLFALGLVLEALLGWSLQVAIPVAALVVLSYTFLGGLSAAIYNEVLQFFVILALLVPLTIAGLARVGGWNGLVEQVRAGPGGPEQLSAWPGTALTEIENPFLSVVGIVFGLGFVLSFGYWTTNFAEVHRHAGAGGAVRDLAAPAPDLTPVAPCRQVSRAEGCCALCRRRAKHRWAREPRAGRGRAASGGRRAGSAAVVGGQAGVEGQQGPGVEAAQGLAEPGAAGRVRAGAAGRVGGGTAPAARWFHGCRVMIACVGRPLPAPAVEKPV